MLLLSIVMQILSGFYLGWYFIPEPGLVIELREEMFNETRFGFEIFQMHVRGVDTIFVLSYLHILKKIWLTISTYDISIMALFWLLHLPVIRKSWKYQFKLAINDSW